MSNIITVLVDSVVRDGIPQNNYFLVCLNTTTLQYAYPLEDLTMEQEDNPIPASALEWKNMYNADAGGKLFALDVDGDVYYNVAEKDDDGDHVIFNIGQYDLLIDINKEIYLPDYTEDWQPIKKN